MSTFDVIPILQGVDYDLFNLFFSIVCIFGLVSFTIGLLVRIVTRS